MTATALLAHLHNLGVVLWADGDRLRYNAPKAVLTPTLRAELTEHKREILAFLRKANVVSANAVSPPLLPASRNGYLPLSFAQQRLWFLNQLEPGSPFYNIFFSIQLTGLLNSAALAQSFNQI